MIVNVELTKKKKKKMGNQSFGMENIVHNSVIF